LETHAQLSTRSKIFSGASTVFGAAPNTQASVVDLALPGTLPVLNEGAVERAIRFGLAIGGIISPRSIFARKNYFYPDLPKGYQISQYELPVVQGGSLAIQTKDGEKVVHLTRAHLEEDAGKSLHEDFHGMSGIDLNRAGTPLLEIVSEPEMHSAEEAVAYAKALHSLVRWIDICDGNMQEGSFRCDANVSVRRPGAPLGTRREIKNLNSFRFLQQAIEYEIRWQIETLEDGGKIQQATVLFDPDKGETRMMRTKEDAHDYRYFPDPDLLPLEISEEWTNNIKAQMPELPGEMRGRIRSEYDLTEYDAKVLTQSRELAGYFETIAKELGHGHAKLAANWVMGEFSGRLNREELEISAAPIQADAFAGLIRRIADGTISGKIAKEVFDAMWGREGSADEVIERKGLKQISDSGAIEKIVDEVLAANAQQVADYKSGKEKAFNSLVGQVMKASRGKANPAQVNGILKKKLG
jgi:aspartyl-tRNA(Asn)/glutamyl-tRNA(Gln) amidotransferase subunit B